MWFKINLISSDSSRISVRHLSLMWAVLSQCLQPWRGKFGGKVVWFVGGGWFELEWAKVDGWVVVLVPSFVECSVVCKTIIWLIWESTIRLKARRWFKWVSSSVLRFGGFSHMDASIFLYEESRDSNCWEGSCGDGCCCGFWTYKKKVSFRTR